METNILLFSLQQHQLKDQTPSVFLLHHLQVVRRLDARLLHGGHLSLPRKNLPPLQDHSGDVATSLWSWTGPDPPFHLTRPRRGDSHSLITRITAAGVVSSAPTTLGMNGIVTVYLWSLF